VIMADFWYRHRGKYPALATVSLPRYNVRGLFAYAMGAVAAYASPWVAPLVGIGASALCYILLVELNGRRRALGQARVEP